MAFKIAEAVVEVKVDVDKAGAKASSEKAADEVAKGLSSGASKTKVKKAGGEIGEVFGKESGEKGGLHFFEHFDKDVEKRKPSLLKRGLSAGLDFGKTFAKGVVTATGQGFKEVGDAIPTQLKPLLIAAAIPVAATLAAIWGPAIGAALVGGIGIAAVGGALAVGIAMGFRDEAIQNAVHDLKESIVQNLTTSTQAFVPAMQGAIKVVKSGWDDISLTVGKALAKSAQYVQPLTQGFTNLVKNLMPGLTNAIEAAGPIVAQLKSGLEGTGKSLGKLFQTVADNADSAASGIELLFVIVEGTINTLASALDSLASGWVKVTKFGKESTDVFAAMAGWMPVVGGYSKDMNAIWTELNKTATGEHMDTYARQIKGVGTSMTDAERDALLLRTANANLTNSFKSASTEAGTLKAALDALNGAAVDSEQAELAYQEAIDNATASAKENGATTDANTEKGRNNRQALLELRDSIIGKVQATYDETLATKGQAAADQAAGAAAAAGRQQLIATAIQMGMTKQEAIDYANRLLKIPGQVGTYVNINDIDAKERIQAVKDALARVPGSKTININVKADIPPGLSMGFLMRANGGVIESYAGGGIRSERHEAQIARAGAWRMWAEPETGGEAYIPLASSKRKKSIQVLRRTNELLDSPLVDPQSGGSRMSTQIINKATLASTPSGQNGSTTVNNYYVNMVADLSKIKNVDDVVRLFSSVQSTSRQFRGASASVMA